MNFLAGALIPLAIAFFIVSFELEGKEGLTSFIVSSVLCGVIIHILRKAV